MRDNLHDFDDADGENFQPWLAVAVIAFVATFWICVFMLIRWAFTS